MKKLIFNADDFGYSYGVNYGIIESHLRGVLDFRYVDGGNACVRACGIARKVTSNAWGRCTFDTYLRKTGS